eukprot:8189075-Pyramimonas_sp.AAC.1
MSAWLPKDKQRLRGYRRGADHTGAQQQLGPRSALRRGLRTPPRAATPASETGATCPRHCGPEEE